MRKIICIFIMLLTLVSSVSCEKADSLTILCPKIGKADAFIIKGNNECAMIDTGEADDYDEISKNLQQNGINKIDCLIITHFDKDHVGSASSIIDHYEVEKILRTNHPVESTEYDNFVHSCETKGITPETITEMVNFSVCGADFTIFPPMKEKYEKDADNNSSLVIEIKKDGKTLLFAGDAKEERLAELASQGISDCDLLKYPHHGSFNKSTEIFISSVKPEYCIISCSDKNPPEDKTTGLLKKSKIKTYETRNGDIKITVLNGKIKISQ